MSPHLLMGIQLADPRWLSAHPDLTSADLAAIIRLARLGEDRIARGEIGTPATYQALPFGETETLAFIRESATHLRAILAAQDRQRATAQPVPRA